MAGWGCLSFEEPPGTERRAHERLTPRWGGQNPAHGTDAETEAQGRPSPVPPSRRPPSPLGLPGCGWSGPGPPRPPRPLAICCSRGTSTAVSQDSDCRSPGRSSSPAVARSLQGGRELGRGGALRPAPGAPLPLESPPEPLTSPSFPSPCLPTFQSPPSGSRDPPFGSQITQPQSIPSFTLLACSLAPAPRG